MRLKAFQYREVMEFLRRAGILCSLALTTGCGPKFFNENFLPDLEGRDQSAVTSPAPAFFQITDISPTANDPLTLNFGAIPGVYDQYCIEENLTNVTSCNWISGSLPASYSTATTDGSVVLSVWLKSGSDPVSTRVDSNTVVVDRVAPMIASLTVTNSNPTNTNIYSLSYGSITGSYSDHCFLENDINVNHCVWSNGSLPASRAVTTTEGAKVLSFWLRDTAGNISNRVDSNSVTLDTTAPILASASITNSSPTSTTVYGLSYGSITGTYASYCIRENSTVVGGCTWTAGTLPASFNVSATNNSKILSVWIRDAAGNVSTRVDTNSVTLDTTAPILASASITSGSPTNNTTLSLSYGAVTGSYSEYCILENNTNSASCTYTAGTLPATFTASGVDGAVVLSVWLRDTAGNVSTRVDTNSITFDGSAPVLASVTVTNSSPTNTTTYNLSYGAVTGTYSQYCILENDTTVGNCSFTAGTLPASFTVSGTNNAKVLSVWLRDGAGNTSARVNSNSVTLDTVAPILASATVTNTSPTSSQTYNLSYGSVTGTYASYCILENSTTVGSCSWTVGTLPASFGVSATNNAKVLSVWLRDAAGNVSTRVDTNSVTLDTTAPVLASASITSGTPTNDPILSLSYGAVTGSYSEYCILENNTNPASCTYTAGTLPATFSSVNVAESKTLSVWLRDTAGNVSTRVDTNTVVLNPSPVSLASVTVTNSNPTNSTTYNLTYGAASTYDDYCILENNTTVGSCAWVTGTLPATYTVSATENAKVLSVWLRNSAMTVSGRVDSNSVTLDTTAPILASASITNSSPTNDTTYDLTYGAVTGSYASYCIRENSTVVGGCAWTNGTLPASFTVSGTNNAKVLSVWIRDAAGNISTRVDTNSVTLDTTAPILASASITSSSPTNNTTLSLSYGAVTGSYSEYCILENNTNSASCTYTAGTLPATFTASGVDGAVVLSVWLRDTAGNVSTRVDTNSITFDGSAPVLASVTVTNATPTNSTTYNLTYGTVTGAYTQYCILENDTTVGNCSFTAGTLPASFTVSATNNAKVLSVWLRDDAGNTSARVNSNSVTLDTVAPILASATVTNTSPTNNTTYDLTYGAITGTYASYCILENSTTVGSCSWTNGTVPASFTVSGTNNAKVLSVWIRDAAGNISTRVDTNSVTLDTTAPILASASITSSSPTNNTTLSLSYGAVTGSYSEYCILENNTNPAFCVYTAGALPATFTASGVDGAVVLSVWLKDSTGNVSTRVDTNSITFDATAPVLASVTITNATPTNSTTYNLTYGTVTGTYTQYCILENDTTVGNCSFTAGTLPASFTVSGTNNAKVLSVWLRDGAGNTSARVNSNSVTLDTVAPTVTLTSHTGGQAYLGGSTSNVTWTATDGSGIAANSILVEYSSNGGGSWSNVATSEANDGTYTWSTPGTDTANGRIRISATDAAGNTGSSASGTSFAVDSTAPVFTAGQMDVNGGAGTTISNYVSVAFTATDSATNVTHYCLKYNSTAAPAANDGCWIGVTPTSSLSPTVDFRLGFTAGAYTVYAWAKNSLDLVSALNGGTGIDNRDRDAITFAPVPPPVLTNVTASSSDGSINLSIPAGNSVYIKWNASSAGSLSATPISLYYTTDDTNYTLIANNVLNAQGVGCTISGSETGCYRWTNSSPFSTYYRIRVGALDTNSRLSYQSTPPINVTSTLRVIAGVNDPGTGGSAESALFMTQNASTSYVFPQSLLVATNGVVYFNDAIRGLLKIDPSDGIQQLLIPRTGTITNGAVPGVATLRRPVRLAFDHQGRVLIFDYNVIRRYDPVAGSISTIIGGGGSTADTVAPLSLSMSSATANTTGLMMFGTPDGKIYFQSRYAGTVVSSGFDIRVYDPNANAGAGEVTTLKFTGQGTNYSGTQDITFCSGYMMGASYNPVTSALTKVALGLQHSTGGCSASGSGVYYSIIDPTTKQPVGPHPTFDSFSSNVTGNNGALYSMDRVLNLVKKFDPATQTFSAILGTGTNGSCADDTLATSCNIDVSDIYVDANNQLYYLERGRIRTIDQSNRVQTLMGSGFYAGDGGLATSARLGNVNDLKLWNNGTNDLVAFYDASAYRFREFTIDGNISTLAGNGSHGLPDTTSAANAQPISYNENGIINEVYLQVNLTDGTLYTGARRSSRLSYLNRTTGRWVDLVGGGADAYYSGTADGKTGANINLTGSYAPKVLGYDGVGTLLVHKHRYSAPNEVDSFFKTYTTANGTQAHLAGITGNSPLAFSADGTAGNLTAVSRTLMSASWDAFSSRWVFMTPNDSTKVRTQTVGGAIGTIATLTGNAQNFVYRHDASNNIVYYCNSSTGVLNKYNVTTSSNAALSWPITKMVCSGKGMVWSSTRNSLIFSYTQDGTGGIAEYLNP